jgi:XrtN system VIT domain protein
MKKIIWKQINYVSPIIAILCAILVLFINKVNSDFIVVSLVVFVIWWAHLIYYWIVNKKDKKANRIAHITNIALLNISCFALNKDIQMFAPFVWWVYVILTATYLVLYIDAYVTITSKIWHFIYSFIIALGILVAFYFTIITIPLIGFGFLACIALGLGIHVFAPLILLIELCNKMYNDAKQTIAYIGFYFGLIITLGILAYVGISWQQNNKLVFQNNFTEAISTNIILPSWVKIAQKMKPNFISKAQLIGDMQYDYISDIFSFRGMNSGNSYGDVKIHDPIFNIANACNAKLKLTDIDKLQVLKTTFNDRHNTSRKLWTGENLETNQLITDVELYPKWRIAYTQKTIFIENTSSQSWRTDEEALYTLHLPKDAVVCGMSLWVNGIERKSVLTTKEKADSAYVNIVGVERRDPSLLHWQEGNKVSLTVFPCTNNEVRKVKVNYITPMQIEKEELIYKDVMIEGPKMNNTKCDINIVNKNESSNVKGKGISIKKTKQNQWQAHYNGDNEWEIQMPLLPIEANNSFCFEGNLYTIQQSNKLDVAIDFQNIYVDVNKKWNEKDWNGILEIATTKKVYVALDNKWIGVTPSNNKDLWKELQKLQFNIIPFSTIIDLKNAVIVTKGVANSPSLKDLDTCIYAKQTIDFCSKLQEPIICINIGESMNGSIIGTLCDFGFLQQTNTNIDRAKYIIQNNKIEKATTDSNKINIESANICIIKSVTKDTNSNAPDHLMRLFSYQKIMNNCGKFYLNRSEDTKLKECVTLANNAFVLSPVSSLITLETDKDYKDYNIKPNEHSLQNATKSGSGSVPEPHEWAMIILACLVIVYLYCNHKL